MKHSRSIRRKVYKRKISNVAAYSRRYTVKHNTIKTANDVNLSEIDLDNGHTIVVNDDIDRKGNGKKRKEHKWLQELKKKRIDYLKELLAEKYPKIKRKHPWYKLLKVENKSLFNKTTINNNSTNSAAYTEQYTQHKLKRWEKENPCPINVNSNPKDLFEEEYLKPWQNERDAALERIRDFVVSVYDKLYVVGNKVDKTDGKMVPASIEKIKDIGCKGHDVNHPSLKESDKLYIHATKTAQKMMNNDSTIVDCCLLNHKKNQKRPLIHAIRYKKAS